MSATNEQTKAPMTSNSIATEYVVYGLGKTGVSCARFLTGCGIRFTIIDTRDQPPGLSKLMEIAPDTVVFLGGVLPQSFGACKQLVLSPGVSRSHPFVLDALREGIEVIGDIELFARHVATSVIAITGSNGKSTVVTMVAEILAAAEFSVRCGGNLGTPALDLLEHHLDVDCFVLELSSFQLESTMSLAPKVACILNISPDHLDRYDDFAAYVDAKKRILQNAECLVFNAEDEMLSAMPEAGETNFIAIGATSQYRIEVHQNVPWLMVRGNALMRADEIPVHGEHNYLNALAALAITDIMSVSSVVQAQALKQFSGLPHRCRTISTQQSIEWIDDSKGTNVGASCAAIRAVFAHKQGILIAGGQGKGADFAPLARAVRDCVRAVVLVGEDANIIAAKLSGNAELHFAGDMTAAVTAAALLAQSGEAVLLSPACASQDMFENFEARGIAFADAVADLVTQ
jgi:UDP-N-acetylmuramoylalanine--D-glutamate ligase